jgi:hypothetical protein
MARPIKETPILFGEDARRFEARMKEKRHISAEERARIDEAYRIGMEMMRRGEELDLIEDRDAANTQSSMSK